MSGKSSFFGGHNFLILPEQYLTDALKRRSIKAGGGGEEAAGGVGADSMSFCIYLCERRLARDIAPLSTKDSFPVALNST